MVKTCPKMMLLFCCSAVWLIPPTVNVLAQGPPQNPTAAPDVSGAMVFQPGAAIPAARRASDLIGANVFDSSNRPLGTIKDFVVALPAGQIDFIIISTQSGARAIAVPASMMTRSGHDFLLGARERQLTSAPDFAKMDLQDQGWAHEVNSHFGVSSPTLASDAVAANGAVINEPAGAEAPASTPAAPTAPALARSSDLAGMAVRDAEGDAVGDIKDVTLDLKTGRVVYAVLDPDGTPGFGRRYIAVLPHNLSLTAAGGTLVLNVGKQQLGAAPSFDPARWPSADDQTFVTQVSQYWQNQ